MANRLIEINPIPYQALAVKSEKIQVLNNIQSIILYVKLNITTAPTTWSTDAPFNIIRELRVIGDGRDIILTLYGEELRDLHELVGYEADYDTTGKTWFRVQIPLFVPLSEYRELTVRIEWNDASALGSGTAIGDGEAKILVDYRDTIPFALKYNVYEKVINGEDSFDLPIGNIIKYLLVKTTDYSEEIEKVEIKDGAEIFVSGSYTTLKAIGNTESNVLMRKGVLGFNFNWQWHISPNTEVRVRTSSSKTIRLVLLSLVGWTPEYKEESQKKVSLKI